jgi:LacI family repressor for deo operon, udp, cdd, tsx, nupC, and nupG
MAFQASKGDTRRCHVRLHNRNCLPDAAAGPDTVIDYVLALPASPGSASNMASSSKAASIIAVARHAGVSVATVSRVMNGQDSVRATTREHVLAAVSSLQYRPNVLARNLRTAESRLLLVMVPDIGNPFYAEIMHGIDEVARERGYFVMLCHTGAGGASGHACFELLRRRQADGAVCLDPATVQTSLARDAADLPWVACCEFDPRISVPYVGIDNRAAAFGLVSYLLGRGYRRIALVNTSEAFLYARQRREGWRDALHAAGITPLPDWIRTVPSLDYAQGKATAADLLGQAGCPDAIFAVSDTLAIGIMAGLRAAGRRVPDDVAVAGFDDIALASCVDPALTTVAQPMRELGRTAAEVLLQRLAGGAAAVRGHGILLRHRLVPRASA